MTAPTAPETPGQRVDLADLQEFYGHDLAELHHRCVGLALEVKALRAENETLRQQAATAQRGGDPATFGGPTGQTVEGAPTV